MHDFVTLNQGYKSLFDDAGKLSLILHIRPSYSYSMGAITKSQDQLKEALNTSSRVRISVLTPFEIDLGKNYCIVEVQPTFKVLELDLRIASTFSCLTV